MASQSLYVPWQTLQQAAQAIFQGGGSPEPEAELIAARLVKANLTGHDSHGLIRVHPYMERLREGKIQPGQTLTPLRESGPTAVFSANRGYGHPAATEAMRRAIGLARTHHLAAVGLTEVNHIGRLADYAVMAADAGMIGMVFTTDGGYFKGVAPFGAAEPRISTNPISVAFPSDRAFPLVLDMATSGWALGKFLVLQAKGQAAPPGMLLDAQGRPTEDAHAAGHGGAILPLGGAQGYKGTLLAFWVEVMAGLLTGGGTAGPTASKVMNNATTMIVLDVSAFRELPSFKAELEGLIAYLKESRTLPGGEVLYPGEKEARTEQERRAHGIPLAPATVDDLQSELERCQVPVRLRDSVLQPAKPAPA
jgi:uncharacterized oxidoreductase